MARIPKHPCSHSLVSQAIAVSIHGFTVHSTLSQGVGPVACPYVLSHAGQAQLGSVGAEALAGALRVNGSMTRLDVRYNPLREEGEAVLRKAVERRSGFELVL